jgi:diguanylate cyclase (GGDEF)-like protein/putative nucleotidyltransferase with HDIG domain
MAKVLFVDDEEVLRLTMGRQLRRAGHAVTVAEDGMEAAEILAREPFDVVISDMNMPRLDGMGLLAKAKQLAPKTEFIIITGHGSLENAVIAFKTGNVFDYLLKPLDDIYELNAVVARAVEHRQLLAENGRLVQELEARVQELEVSNQELHAAREKLAYLAERDGLTGLYNHRAIHARLEAALLAAPDDPFSIILMDLDNFKPLNDTYGHPVGDQALRHLADTLRATCPPTALLGRYGGDEFIIVLPGVVAEDAQRLAQEIRQYLADHPFVTPNNANLPMRLCFGIANVIDMERSPLTLVTAADAALYAGKRDGGDAITLHVTNEAETEDSSRTTFDVLDSLVTAIDQKDRYTRQHSEDVTCYALLLAQALGCSEEVYNIVRVAGLLHDVGKIGIPSSLLRKPGGLTQDEREIMKSHVVISTLIIHGLPHLSDITEAVATHHERWDGTGYPKQLAGDQIPLLGRIMAIADAFSAMTLDRPYRAGMSVESALCEIEAASGKQFDPNLVPIFVQAIREQGSKYRVKQMRAA